MSVWFVVAAWLTFSCSFVVYVDGSMLGKIFNRNGNANWNAQRVRPLTHIHPHIHRNSHLQERHNGNDDERHEANGVGNRHLQQHLLAPRQNLTARKTQQQFRRYFHIRSQQLQKRSQKPRSANPTCHVLRDRPWCRPSNDAPLPSRVSKCELAAVPWVQQPGARPVSSRHQPHCPRWHSGVAQRTEPHMGDRPTCAESQPQADGRENEA